VIRPWGVSRSFRSIQDRMLMPIPEWGERYENCRSIQGWSLRLENVGRCRSWVIRVDFALSGLLPL
jgi:hypothetical protein